jgi:hypothetical protein
LRDVVVPPLFVFTVTLVPRTKKNTEKYNKELNSICRQENIDFVNHSENFLLKNGKIVNGLLYSRSCTTSIFTVAFSFKIFVLMSLVIELPMMSTFPVFFWLFLSLSWFFCLGLRQTLPTFQYKWKT